MLASQSELHGEKSCTPLISPQAPSAPPSATAPTIPGSQRTAIQFYSPLTQKQAQLAPRGALPGQTPPQRRLPGRGACRSTEGRSGGATAPPHPQPGMSRKVVAEIIEFD